MHKPVSADNIMFPDSLMTEGNEHYLQLAWAALVDYVNSLSIS